MGLGVAAYRLAPPPPDAADRPALPAAYDPASPLSAATTAVTARSFESACTVAPQTVEGILALYGPQTPIATPGEPVTTMSPLTDEPMLYLPRANLPAGRPADSTTVAAVTETWHRWSVCNRSWDDRLRAAALLTDDGVRRIYQFSSLTDLALFLDPLSYDESATAPVDVTAEGVPTLAPTNAAADADLPVSTGPEPPTGVRVLADGHVGALLETGIGAPDPEGRNNVVYAKIGDRWLIDEIVRMPAGCPPALPCTPPAPLQCEPDPASLPRRPTKDRRRSDGCGGR